MTSAEVIVIGLTTALAGVSAVAVSLGLAWRRAAARAARLEERILWAARPDLNPAASDLVSAQLDQLASQVERLTEGQDFLARVLADRAASQPPPLAPEPRIPTPH
jgi:hypothetical protein